MALFCTREHPLVLFLDDIQWADLPSLDLIETMMSIEDGTLMLVLAYRDNEVDESHPFIGMVKNIPEQFIKRIPVEPLKANCTTDIISDIVHQGPGDIEPLSPSDSEKNGGQPLLRGGIP